MENIFRSVGWKLMNLRQGKDLTQLEMAEKVGLSNYQISRMERGHGDTTLKNLETACDFFAISMEELFQREEKVKIDIALRESTSEKHPNGVSTLHFTKVLESSGKMRIIKLPYKTAKSLRAEKDLNYDIFALKGIPSIRSYNDSIQIKPGQAVSMKGHGFAKLLNIHEEPAAVLIFSY